MSQTRLTRPTRAPRRSRRFAGVASVLLGASLVLFAGVAHAAQPPVGLGTASSFAVLAGSGITNTGATTITGDVGTFPTASESGFGTVTQVGTNHAGDSVTQGAKDDLVTAYNDAAGRTPVTNVPVELGSTTKLAGVYASGTFGLTGTLTLDAKGNSSAVFIFQTQTTLTTAVNSQVLFINGANPCNVFWKIGSSASFGAGTQFVGTVLAHDAITVDDGAAFLGRLLARNANVTLIHDTITKGDCAVLPTVDTTTTSTTSTTLTTATTSGTAGLTSTGGTGGGSGSGGADTTGTSRSSTPGLPATGSGDGVLAAVGMAFVAIGLGAVFVGRRNDHVPAVAVGRPWPPRYDLWT